MQVPAVVEIHDCGCHVMGHALSAFSASSRVCNDDHKLALEVKRKLRNELDLFFGLKCPFGREHVSIQGLPCELGNSYCLSTYGRNAAWKLITDTILQNSDVTTKK
jgi:hypothetical protein